jgi:hypothetical protein
MNRRGFLKGLFTAVAIVAIEVKLQSAAPVAPKTTHEWSEANDRYYYGIDTNDPLDVVIYDTYEGHYISPRELMHVWHDGPNPNSFRDSYDDAYEATAVIAMSQAHLLWKHGDQRWVSVDSAVWEMPTKEHDVCLCKPVPVVNLRPHESGWGPVIKDAQERLRINPECRVHGVHFDEDSPYILTAA